MRIFRNEKNLFKFILQAADKIDSCSSTKNMIFHARLLSWLLHFLIG